MPPLLSELWRRDDHLVLEYAHAGELFFRGRIKYGSVPDDLRKEAAEMLLGGATLVREPCPYCGGVRVMKDGSALCTNCGKRPAEEKIPAAKNPALDALKEKLARLAEELHKENDPPRQRELLQAISAVTQSIMLMMD